jgi:hypothetical protein
LEDAGWGAWACGLWSIYVDGVELVFIAAMNIVRPTHLLALIRGDPLGP